MDLFEDLRSDVRCEVIEGDCVEKMREMPEASIDAIVTDPPYGLEFMGKEWDSLKGEPEHWNGWEAPKGRYHNNTNFLARGNRPRYGNDGRAMQQWHEAWAREAFRVLKPGAFLLAFGGTRTIHRLGCAIEDAGFEIRDRLLNLGGGDATESMPGELAWIYGSG